MSSNSTISSDPLRAFLDQRASCSRSLYTSDEVQATHYTLVDGTQLVLKVTSKDRAEFEWNQVQNEVKAAKSLPDCSCLGHQVAWKAAQDGSFLSVSLYAGPTVEALLGQEQQQQQAPPGYGGGSAAAAAAGGGGDASGGGGWSGLDLRQRVEVARDVLAGGVHALIKMRPWLHFDVKPANVAVMPCPAGGPPHITLLDMGATTHIAALHTPSRSTLYPVVSTDHMDVALITRQPGQDQMPYESKQGCRDALSHNTDIFTLGLLGYKILLGPQLPPELDWYSNEYSPWEAPQEEAYVAVQQRLARDLAAGSSSHASTQALLQALPQDCRHALGRMCDPDPANRAQLQEVAQLPFLQQRLAEIAVYAPARDAAYAQHRQQVISMLQGIEGIELAARPIKSQGQRLTASNSMGDVLAAAATATAQAASPAKAQQAASGRGATAAAYNSSSLWDVGASAALAAPAAAASTIGEVASGLAAAPAYNSNRHVDAAGVVDAKCGDSWGAAGVDAGGDSWAGDAGDTWPAAASIQSAPPPEAFQRLPTGTNAAPAAASAAPAAPDSGWAPHQQPQHQQWQQQEEQNRYYQQDSQLQELKQQPVHAMAADSFGAAAAAAAAAADTTSNAPPGFSHKLKHKSWGAVAAASAAPSGAAQSAEPTSTAAPAATQQQQSSKGISGLSFSYSSSKHSWQHTPDYDRQLQDQQRQQQQQDVGYDGGSRSTSQLLPPPPGFYHKQQGSASQAGSRINSVSYSNNSVSISSRSDNRDACQGASRGYQQQQQPQQQQPQQLVGFERARSLSSYAQELREQEQQQRELQQQQGWTNGWGEAGTQEAVMTENNTPKGSSEGPPGFWTQQQHRGLPQQQQQQRYQPYGQQQILTNSNSSSEQPPGFATHHSRHHAVAEGHQHAHHQHNQHQHNKQPQADVSAAGAGDAPPGFASHQQQQQQQQQHEHNQQQHHQPVDRSAGDAPPGFESHQQQHHSKQQWGDPPPAATAGSASGWSTPSAAAAGGAWSEPTAVGASKWSTPSVAPAAAGTDTYFDPAQHAGDFW